MGEPAKTFQDLLVWQKAHSFVLSVYRITALFPKDEILGCLHNSDALPFLLHQISLRDSASEARRTKLVSSISRKVLSKNAATI